MAKAFRSTKVVTPEGLRPAALLVENGRIADVLDWNQAPRGTDLHDFGDNVLLPGLVDSHVHINEPGRTEWEGFKTATQAAAAGGVTTLVDMPLNCVPETTDESALEAKRKAARGQTWVDWAAWGGVVCGNAEQLPALIRCGVPGFKCFMIHSGIDGFAWVDEADLLLALGKLRGSGLPLLVHAEVAGPVNAATEMLNAAHADWRKYSTYLASRPDAAELDAIALLIRLTEEFNSPIHIVHLASAKALPMLADARRRGLPITVETCTQYLWFVAEEIPDGATEYKCAPPIRDSANREALWNALETGLIDMVTTDHSPCPPAMKQRETGRWDLAWGGIASLGLALPVLWTGMSQRGLGIEKIGEWMAAAPAKLAGLSGRKGTLTAGADADFVAFNPDARWTVEEKDLHFRHKLSPYLGAELRGRVVETWLGGGRVYGADGFSAEARGTRVGALVSEQAKRVIDECGRIAAMTEEPGRITRRFLTPPVHAVHAYLRGHMQTLGMQVHVDAAGNLRGLWLSPGAGVKRLVMGSHIDTVPDAGAYDGVLGVVIALEWVRIAQELKLPFGIEIIAFSEEEGVRFGVPFIGSRAVAGRFDEDILEAKDSDGVTLEAAIRAFGLDPGKIGEAELDKNAVGFVEVHIEQGPVLESEWLSVAAVTAIVGQTRLTFEFIGHANHAGTTPMRLRHDALTAAAEWIQKVETLALATDGLVATVGKVTVEPNAGNVVPGVVKVTLDVRHAIDSTRKEAIEKLIENANAIASRRNLTVKRTRQLDQPAVPMDERLTSFLTDAIEASGFPLKQMTSGAGHDAMVMATRVPTAMLFLRSPGGISHHPDETVLEEDVAASLEVGRKFLERLAAEIR